MKRRTKMSVAVTCGLAVLAGLTPLAYADQNAAQTVVVSATPVANTPQVKDGRVEAVAKLGNRVYVGGTFTQQKDFKGNAPMQSRKYLFSYDATTGLIDPNFNPQLNGTVSTLAAAPDGSGILVGGAFSNVNSVARAGLVKLNPATGATLTAFKGTAGGGPVLDLDVVGNRVYLTGQFSKVTGVAKTRLAAVDLTTGKIDPELELPLTGYNKDTLGEYELDVAQDGSKLIVIGNFGQIGGVARSQVALVDLTTSPDSVANWSTSHYPQGGTWVSTQLRNVDIDATGTYAVIGATCCPSWDWNTGDPTILFDAIARFELAPTGAQQPTWWNWTNYDTITSVAISGPVVYIGGHFRHGNLYRPDNYTGGVTRAGLMALDPATGVNFNWNPGRDRGYGVLDMLVTADQLIIGHDTNYVANLWKPRLAAFPAATGITIPAIVQPTLPTNLWSLPAAAGTPVAKSTFDGEVIGAPAALTAGDWSGVHGAFVNDGKLYAGAADGRLYRYTWDGTVWSQPVDLFTRSDWANGVPMLDMRQIEAMAYGRNGIFFTKTGDPKLYWSGFNFESNLIGTPRIVSGLTDGANWSSVKSLTMVGDTLYATSTDGTLSSMAMAGRTPNLASKVTLSGPAVDGRTWGAEELFAFNG